MMNEKSNPRVWGPSLTGLLKSKLLPSGALA